MSLIKGSSKQENIPQKNETAITCSSSTKMSLRSSKEVTPAMLNKPKKNKKKIVATVVSRKTDLTLQKRTLQNAPAEKQKKTKDTDIQKKPLQNAPSKKSNKFKDYGKKKVKKNVVNKKVEKVKKRSFQNSPPKKLSKNKDSGNKMKEKTVGYRKVDFTPTIRKKKIIFQNPLSDPPVEQNKCKKLKNDSAKNIEKTAAVIKEYSPTNRQKRKVKFESLTVSDIKPKKEKKVESQAKKIEKTVPVRKYTPTNRQKRKVKFESLTFSAIPKKEKKVESQQLKTIDLKDHSVSSTAVKKKRVPLPVSTPRRPRKWPERRRLFK